MSNHGDPRERVSVSLSVDPLRPAVTARLGSEYVKLSGYDTPDVWMREIYEAAKRDVRAQMTPADRPGVKIVRVGNRVSLSR